MNLGRFLLESAALFGAVLLVARPVAADTPSVVAHLDYEAPTGCPEARTFERLVHGRTQRVVFADTGESTRFIVRVRQSADGFVGTLSRRETNGESLAARQVRGANCATVVDALALTAALSVDPEALLGSETTSEATPSTGTATTTSPSSPSSPEQPGKSPKPPPGPGKPDSKPDGTPDVPPDEPPEPDDGGAWFGSSSEPARFMLGAFGGYAYWVNPGGMLLGRITFGISTDLPLPVTLEVSALFAASRPLGAVDEASFELFAVAPRLCMGRLGEQDGINARPCLSFSMGQLAGEGQDISQPGSTQRAIFAPGAALVVGGPLDAGFSWQVEAALSVPLISRRFFVGDVSNVVGETPPVVPEVVAGASYSF